MSVLQQMIKQAAANRADFRKIAVEPMVPPPNPGGPPPMDPMAGGGAPPPPGAMPPMDPAAMGGMPPMDPSMMDPAMLGLPPEGEPPPEDPANDAGTDVNSDGKADTMVPLEGIRDFTVGIIEATKGKKTQEASDPNAGGGEAEAAPNPMASIGGPPMGDAMSAMPKLSLEQILDRMSDDLR